jgi:hypothetical protein
MAYRAGDKCSKVFPTPGAAVSVAIFQHAGYAALLTGIGGCRNTRCRSFPCAPKNEEATLETASAFASGFQAAPTVRLSVQRTIAYVGLQAIIIPRAPSSVS